MRGKVPLLAFGTRRLKGYDRLLVVHAATGDVAPFGPEPAAEGLPG